MKILFKNEKFKKGIVKCKYCKSQYEYNEKDIERYHNDIWSYTDSYVECPVCKNNHYIVKRSR